MRTKIARALFVFALAPFLPFARADIPDLAKLKAAAEAGNMDAEFEFAHHFPIGGAEWRKWLEAGVAQGDGRADDELAWTLNWSYFAVSFPNPAMRASHLKSNRSRMREALVLASSAADKGFGRSRLLLGMAYANGYLLNQDSAEAYMWLKLAQSSDFTANFSASQLRDRLLKEMPLEGVEERERRAAAFQAGGTADLIRTQLTLPLLKLEGVATMGGQRVAILNRVKLRDGGDTRLNLDGLSILIHTIAVNQDSVIFCLPPASQRYEIRPGFSAAALAR
jgi:hypothetical protein